MADDQSAAQEQAADAHQMHLEDLQIWDSISIYGDPHVALEEAAEHGADGDYAHNAEAICDQQVKLRRILQLLIITDRVSASDIIKAAEVADRFA